MKTRIIALLLALALLVPMAALAVSEDVHWVKTPDGKTVNMRAEAKRESDVVTQIPYAAPVNVHYFLMGSPYAYCSYHEFTGYIDRQYLADRKPHPFTPDNTPKPTATPAPVVDNKIYRGFEDALYLATVTPSAGTHTVNLRWAPTKDAPIQIVSEGGQTLLVVAENKLWAQVYDLETGMSGFMMKEFLTYVCEYDPLAVGTQQ